MSELHTRKEKRTPVTLKIKFKSATLDQFIERYSVDVSHGGIFIRTKDPLSVGTQLRFEFQLQDASPLISGDGTVVWTREFDPSRVGVAPGMGVRFDRLAPESQPVLEQILSRKGGGAASQRPVPEHERFEPATGSSPAHGSHAVGEKTRITPPTLASSLVASSRSVASPGTKSTRTMGTLAPARGGFSEEPKDNTPLPKPMPFHVGVEDEFSEDVFEQPTKVASLEKLLKHEEEHARAQAEAERAATAPVVDTHEEDEQTNVGKRKQTASGARPRPAPPPAAAAAAPAPVPAPASTKVTPRAGLESIDEPTPALPQRAGASSEPRFLQNVAPGATPSELLRTVPTPGKQAPAAATKRSSAAPILIVSTVLLGAAAAIYLFVIRGSATGEEEPLVRDPKPPADRVATEPAIAPPKPEATAPEPPTPPPTPPAAPTVAVFVETEPQNAQIVVNGGTPADAPAKLSLEPGKKHEIIARAACYRDETTSLEPKSEGENKLVLKLKPLQRVVRVTSEPVGALVFVDGRPAGRTPGDVKLIGAFNPKVEHTFTIRKPGFNDASTKVAPDAACATEGEMGIVGLSLTLTEAKRVAPAPVVVRKPPPVAVKPKPPVTEPKPPVTEPKPPVTEPKPPEPVAADPPKPVEPIAADPPKPDPVTPKLPDKAPEPKPEPSPKPEAPKPEEPAPKAEPKVEQPATAKPEPTAPPKAEPKTEKKDCDPSPDAPEWARCK